MGSTATVIPEWNCSRGFVAIVIGRGCLERSLRVLTVQAAMFCSAPVASSQV
jgi:hypothetical protein